MAESVKVEAIPCKCPECGDPIERCTHCFVKKKTASIIKDHGAFIGSMILSKLQEYLAKKD